MESVIGSLITERAPIILDLMASWDSHLPARLQPDQVVGLGMNSAELENNAALDRYELHDLNRDPTLPFGDAVFDVVLNALSVDYLTRPLDVFREVGRVLKPGGLFLVLFSNRMFPTKAVKVWREGTEEERLILVSELFALSGCFDPHRVHVSRGKPRPEGDHYADVQRYSDPIYAVFADRSGGAGVRRPLPDEKSRGG